MIARRAVHAHRAAVAAIKDEQQATKALRRRSMDNEILRLLRRDDASTLAINAIPNGVASVTHSEPNGSSLEYMSPGIASPVYEIYQKLGSVRVRRRHVTPTSLPPVKHVVGTLSPTDKLKARGPAQIGVPLSETLSLGKKFGIAEPSVNGATPRLDSLLEHFNAGRGKHAARHTLVRLTSAFSS